MATALNLDNATLSDQTNKVEDYSVDPINFDSATGTKETEYQNNKFSQQLGYYKTIPDLKSAIVQKAIWSVGKGWVADPQTKVILEHFTGWGKDTFDDILFNLEITRRIGGDSYAEIIRDPETNVILNLKPLDPSKIKIIVDDKGVIKRYEQTATIPDGKPIKFKPEEILHLSNNRLGDEIHGISDVDAVEEVLLAQGESFADMKKIMHRSARPLIMFKLSTDDPSRIAKFIAKMDEATQKGENIYIPDDANSVSYEVVQTTPSPIILGWRDDIRKSFYRTIGLPELISSGGGDATESGGKIGYLLFSQLVEKEQRYIEKQLYSQLQLSINLVPPESISPDLQADAGKDGSMAGLNMQPSDTTAGVGR